MVQCLYADLGLGVPLAEFNDKIQWIDETLARLFPDPPIPLVHHDPFTLLVAVLLSAQCTDERVNRVTPALFSLASDPETMSRLPWTKVQDLIRPCGLSAQKAKAIVGLSQQLLDEFHGVVPADLAALERLPGVGHKTASVVMIQAFGQPAFPVDTHIHRLARRWGLSSGRSVRQTECDLKRLFPEKRWPSLHLQMIYYGRTYCPAKKHEPSQCPICHFCAVSEGSGEEASE
jgi:endonuclease-3